MKNNINLPENKDAEDAFYNPHGARSHISTREEDLERLHNSKEWAHMSAHDKKYFETWAGWR